MESALDRRFAAMADPTRRTILARLARGEATVSELGMLFTLSQPAISRHLKVLEAAGLIERGRRAQSRPRRLNVAALREANAWIEEIQTLWSESFDRLDAFLDATDSVTDESKGK
jgi:DNA-binding transcriptional ArsR family regulator